MSHIPVGRAATFAACIAAACLAVGFLAGYFFGGLPVVPGSPALPSAAAVIVVEVGPTHDGTPVFVADPAPNTPRWTFRFPEADKARAAREEALDALFRHKAAGAPAPKE